MMALAGLLIVALGFLGLVLFIIGSIILIVVTILWNVLTRINDYFEDRAIARRERRRKLFRRIFKI